MEDEDLKNFVGTLAKRLHGRFDAMRKEGVEDELGARIEAVLQEPEAGQELLDRLKAVETQGGETWPLKDGELARRNREDGNVAFQSGNHELAIVLYTEAMRYSPVHPTTHEGEDFATAAANRSAALMALGKFEECLEDVQLAIEAGYTSAAPYKLYIRKCKCLLQLGRVVAAQKAFDEAVDAIDRSGLKKDMRKGLAVDLQEAFIKLVKDEGDGNISDSGGEGGADDDAASPLPASLRTRTLPPWFELKDPHPKYPAASSAISIRLSPAFGRQVVATRPIPAGEVVFCESPVVSYLNRDAKVCGSDACYHCHAFIDDDGAAVPCPTCSAAVFCSLKCRKSAVSTYHKYECRLGPIIRSVRMAGHPLLMMTLRAVIQKPPEYFFSNRDKFPLVVDEKNGVEGNNDDLFLTDDYRNLYSLVAHEDKRDTMDVTTKAIFAVFLLRCIQVAGYLREDAPMSDLRFLGRIIHRFLECFQFNTHMVEAVLGNRLIAPDAETRIWKDADKFAHGEFVENVRLGSGIYPTLANVNHSCDPNMSLLNWRNTNVAVANRPIEAGEQLFDTYGALYYHMKIDDRKAYVKKSHWFDCSCPPCSYGWPCFDRLPREYLKLSGGSFKYKRCNRKELQKDVDKVRRRIRDCVNKGDLEATRQLYNQWITLLDELIIPPHQDFVNIRHGMRNCLMLQSPNVVKTPEDEQLIKRKLEYRARQKANVNK